MRQEAVLFLNFLFWSANGNLLWLPFSWPINTLLAAAIVLAFTAMFYAGPAYAIAHNGNGLFATVEASLGRFPTQLVRICALWYLIDWLAGLLDQPILWTLPNILKRDPLTTDSILFSLLLLVFLYATSHEPALARFSIRLSIAILIACAIRVRETPAYFTIDIESLEWNLDRLALSMAPVAFLAAAQSSPQVLRTAALVIALPLWSSVFVVGLINMATLGSSYYQPSGSPNISMALMGGVSSRAIPALYLITSLTLFGPMRLGVQFLRASLPPPVARFGWLSIVAVICYLHFDPLRHWNFITPAIPATILSTTAGVLTASLIRPPKGKWIANLALIAGAIVGGHNIRKPEILPAYATAFAITLAGRKLQRS